MPASSGIRRAPPPSRRGKGGGGYARIFAPRGSTENYNHSIWGANDHLNQFNTMASVLA